MLGSWRRRASMSRRAAVMGRTSSDEEANGRAHERTSLIHEGMRERNGLIHHGKQKAWGAGQRAWGFLRLNYCNVLLPIAPVAIVAGIMKVNPVAVFVLNFLAIIPLASLLSDATEELAEHVGHTLGGLLNATFGNATELIISIFALRKGEIRIVQASMIGSILSNLLLVLGMCFFFGGLRHKEQQFNNTAASTMASLMSVAAASLVIPAALYQTLDATHEPSFDSVLHLSRGTSIVLLVIYMMYIYFQFFSHHHFFVDAAETEDAKDEPVLSRNQSAIVLLATTVVVSFCAEFLVGTIDNVVEAAGLSKTFLGLILIPIVGNAAEHVSSVVVAIENKMNLAVNIAIGSGLQIALLVTPFLVLLGWIMGQPMSLYFQTFETVVFFVSILVVNYLIQDGKSNYLEGAMLMGMYVIIAVSFFVYPDSAANHGGLGGS